MRAQKTLGRALLLLLAAATLSVEAHAQAPAPPYVPTPDPNPDNIPIIVADMPGNRLTRFTDMGGSNYETGPIAEGLAFSAPWHVSATCSGQFFVADRDNNRIVRMNNLAGDGWTTYSGPPSAPFSQLQQGSVGGVISATQDAQGRIYIMNSSSGIVRIDDMTGAGYTKFGPNASGQAGDFNGAKVLIFDPQGRMLISDTANNRIVRMDDFTGQNWTTYGSGGPGVGQFGAPEGLALDPQGRIYIADHSNHRIVRIDDMTGAGWVSFGSFGMVDNNTLTGAVGQLDEPHDLAVTDSGRIYIADTGNGRIVRIDDMNGNGWATFGNRGKQPGTPGTPQCPETREGHACAPPGKWEFIAPKGLRIDPAYLNRPAAPASVTASPGATTVTLAWTPSLSAGISSYLINVGSAPGVTDVRQAETVGTTVTMTDFAPGTYYVRVQAKRPCGISPASAEIAVRLP